MTRVSWFVYSNTKGILMVVWLDGSYLYISIWWPHFSDLDDYQLSIICHHSNKSVTYTFTFLNNICTFITFVSKCDTICIYRNSNCQNYNLNNWFHWLFRQFYKKKCEAQQPFYIMYLIISNNFVTLTILWKFNRVTVCFY